MMTFKRIAFYVGAEHFRPFRIKMVSGETFEIRRSEMIQVGRTTATICTWMNEDQTDPTEHEREISIIPIDSIEPLKITERHEHKQN